MIIFFGLIIFAGSICGLCEWLTRQYDGIEFMEHDDA